MAVNRSFGVAMTVAIPVSGRMAVNRSPVMPVTMTIPVSGRMTVNRRPVVAVTMTIPVSGWMTVNRSPVVAVTAMAVLTGWMTVNRGLVVAVRVVVVQQRVSDHGGTEADGKALPATPLPTAGRSRSGDDTCQKNSDESTGDNEFSIHGLPPFQQDFFRRVICKARGLVTGGLDTGV